VLPKLENGNISYPQEFIHTGWLESRMCLMLVSGSLLLRRAPMTVIVATPPVHMVSQMRSTLDLSSPVIMNACPLLRSRLCVKAGGGRSRNESPESDGRD